jgi:hypothetical protein
MIRFAAALLAAAPLLGACAPGSDQIEVQPVEEMRVPAPVMPDDTLVIDTIMPPDTLPDGAASDEP